MNDPQLWWFVSRVSAMVAWAIMSFSIVWGVLLAILASAWLARRHWQRQPADVRTGSPERALWHGLASYGLLSGHLMATIAWLGPAASGLLESRTLSWREFLEHAC